MTHLHCQRCGTHFLNQAELDRHNGKEHSEKPVDGARGEIPLDAQPKVQLRPAARKDKEFHAQPPRVAGPPPRYVAEDAAPQIRRTLRLNAASASKSSRSH